MIALEKRRHDWLFATLHTVVVFLCFVLIICLCVCLFYIDQDYLVIQQARYKITLTCTYMHCGGVDVTINITILLFNTFHMQLCRPKDVK